jgi:hypothetical protein
VTATDISVSCHQKLDLLAVACEKCGRSGRYRVTTLAKQIGWDGQLTDWLYGLTKDCPRKRSPAFRTRSGSVWLGLSRRSRQGTRYT